MTTTTHAPAIRARKLERWSMAGRLAARLVTHGIRCARVGSRVDVGDLELTFGEFGPVLDGVPAHLADHMCAVWSDYASYVIAYRADLAAVEVEAQNELRAASRRADAARAWA